MVKKKKQEQEALVKEDYIQTLVRLKKQIQEAQTQAVLAANKELIKLYWSIGKTIVEKQERNGWGTSTIEQLAKDLQNAFPGIKGFFRSNIFYMRSFYLAYEKVQKPDNLTRLFFLIFPGGTMSFC